MFRCADGQLIDGKSSGISGVVYRSIYGRDRFGAIDPMCDVSWLHRNRTLLNPLNLGQIVNNCNPKKGLEPNIVYQEVDIAYDSWSHDKFSLLPNINYEMRGSVKVVALVATKTVTEGEELFATYFTLVDS